MYKKELFISHAKKDEPLVDKFVDLLDRGCGLSPNIIFCSSIPDLGVDAGNPNFIQEIEKHLKTAALVIPIISPNFYNSTFCREELGAAWALDIELFPILVNLETSQIQDILIVRQMGKIEDVHYLNNLHDRLHKIYDIEELQTATWHIKRDQFTNALPSILEELPKPQNVSLSEYKKLNETYQESLKLLTNAEEKIQKLEEILEKTKQLKDASEMAILLLNDLPESQQFQEIIERVTVTFVNLPKIVVEAIYYYENGETLDLQQWGDPRIEEANEAVDNGYLLRGEGARYEPDTGDKAVKTAIDEIRFLRNFLNETSREFDEAFYEEYDYKPSLTNKRFWKKFLK